MIPSCAQAAPRMQLNSGCQATIVEVRLCPRGEVLGISLHASRTSHAVMHRQEPSGQIPSTTTAVNTHNVGLSQKNRTHGRCSFGFPVTQPTRYPEKTSVCRQSEDTSKWLVSCELPQKEIRVFHSCDTLLHQIAPQALADIHRPYVNMKKVRYGFADQVLEGHFLGTEPPLELSNKLRKGSGQDLFMGACRVVCLCFLCISLKQLIRGRVFYQIEHSEEGCNAVACRLLASSLAPGWIC